MWVLWVILAIVVIGAIFAVVSYNRFITQKNLIKDAWANIDTELRRRYDLIPNLVETVKGYASHEKEVFEEVTRARASAAGATGTPAQQAAAEGPLVAALGKLFAVAETYPDLKANQNFLRCRPSSPTPRTGLQTARRFYNANVREYNQRVKQFPSVIVANMFGFKEEEFFEVDEAIRERARPRWTSPAPGRGSPSTRRAPARSTPPPRRTSAASAPGRPDPPPERPDEYAGLRVTVPGSDSTGSGDLRVVEGPVPAHVADQQPPHDRPRDRHATQDERGLPRAHRVGDGRGDQARDARATA